MIGKSLAHYEIIDLLGRGGMGEVYRARDTKLGRDVALKVLPSEATADSERFARFQREARSTARLSHPHVVTLHSVDEDRGIHFLTMELLHGSDLGELHRRGRLSLSRALEIGIAIADGLAAAHDIGLIHRDLKPSNIFIATDDQIKILDFGLAKLVDPRPADDLSTTQHVDVTRDGVAIGTLPYMSPEQLSGGVVDARTDVFSLGVLLFESIAGRRPFSGQGMPDLCASILSSDPPAIESIVSEAPHVLSRLIRRCLAKSPDRRIQTARDVRNELMDIRDRDVGTALAQGASHVGVPAAVDRRFTIATRHVRELSEPTTKLIGHDLVYLDNTRASDVVVFCLHGLGTDHTYFESFARTSTHRVVAASLFGFDPHARLRLPLSLSDHNRILRFFLDEVVAPMDARHLVFVGHSAGGDHLSKILGSQEAPTMRPDAVLQLGLTFTLGEGRMTGPFSRLKESPDETLDAVRKVSGLASNLDEWIAVHEYLIQACRKFRHDVAPLRRLAQDFVANYDDDTIYGQFRRLCSRVDLVRCVFGSNDAQERDEALEKHLNRDALGPNFSEEMFIDVEANHIELGLGKTLNPLVDEIVRSLRDRSGG